MANYIELATNRYPVTETQIKAENPNTSYPKPFPTPEGYAVVFQTPQPTYDPITQVVVEIAPTLTNKGHYEQQWQIINLDANTIAANQEAARIKAISVSVSPRQIRQALTRMGLRSAVEAAVAAGDQDLKDWWAYATVFERNHPLVISTGVALGKTVRDMDDLFTLAGSL